ncbi:MAG: hypothetical protein Ct9H300mP29_5990 [Candidatus Neomarinimicrobiota bacterium]|nr:MAG: hypothetical protein Ct9H300mP29_5990 [Candidatus Neomarinimicrobiota bacterium]
METKCTRLLAEFSAVLLSSLQMLKEAVKYPWLGFAVLLVHDTQNSEYAVAKIHLTEQSLLRLIAVIN